MGYFTPELFQFLRQLKRNNDRAWFAKNKNRYIDDVQEPVLQFVVDVGAGLRKLSPHLLAMSDRFLHSFLAMAASTPTW